MWSPEIEVLNTFLTTHDTRKDAYIWLLQAREAPVPEPGEIPLPGEPVANPQVRSHQPEMDLAQGVPLTTPRFRTRHGTTTQYTLIIILSEF